MSHPSNIRLTTPEDDDEDRYTITLRRNRLINHTSALFYFGIYQWIVDLTDFEVIFGLYNIICMLPDKLHIAMCLNCDTSCDDHGGFFIDHIYSLLEVYLKRATEAVPKHYLESSTVNDYFNPSLHATETLSITYLQKDILLEYIECTETFNFIETIQKLAKELQLVKHQLTILRPDLAHITIKFNLLPLANNIQILCKLYLNTIRNEFSKNELDPIEANITRDSFIQNYKFTNSLLDEYQHLENVKCRYDFKHFEPVI